MKIALPVADGKLCMHFGHCETFALIDIDEKFNKILSEEYIPAPPHEPGLLPGWLRERGVSFIIAGGMGGRAMQLFESLNMRVITGVTSDTPAKVVDDFLKNILKTGENVCNHDENHVCDH